MKKKVLILNGQYLPGYKGGGPIQSCANMVENLADQFDFYVLTSDRDFKAEHPYEHISVNEWNQVGAAKVFYMSPHRQTLRGFREILNETEFDILYLNGFFSPIFTIKPLLLRKLGGLKVKAGQIILTPRGDFTGGLENKKIKKYTYILLCKLIGLYSKLLWHATSELEEKDIKLKFKNANTFVIPNLSAKYIPKRDSLNKKKGELRIVFVSRIFPKKNLKYALEVLKQIYTGNVIFDIYGPMEDKAYWSECKAIIKEMPHNIAVTYKGEVSHSEINRVFEQYHTFFFPTLGENYGHVIVESMMNNCLGILSKNVTPWDDYEGNGGFVESLSDKDAFIKVIRKLIEIDNIEFKELVRKNENYVQRKINSN
ncbi:glycosyltransferase family 4 protein, partial [Priestia megaterium]